MANPDYERALSRSDLSQWVVHFVRCTSVISPGRISGSAEILDSIFKEGLIRPSQSDFIKKYCAEGAACFYDAPPSSWKEIIETNPNGRQPIGIICHKRPLWELGGRPVIYTEIDDPDYWPLAERYRIVHTNLSRSPQPIDWMHEREWRVKGGLRLYQAIMNYPWWWPIVPNDDWMNYLWQQYPEISSIYVMCRNGVSMRPAAIC